MVLRARREISYGVESLTSESGDICAETVSQAERTAKARRQEGRDLGGAGLQRACPLILLHAPHALWN